MSIIEESNPDTLFNVMRNVSTDPETGLDVVIMTDEFGSHLEAIPNAGTKSYRFIIDKAIEDAPTTS